MSNESKTLVQLVIEGLDEWRKTGILPNGEKWSPYQESRSFGGKKFQVSSFVSMFCSKFNMNRETAISILRHLENEGKIKIVWHSPKEPYFVLVKN